MTGNVAGSRVTLRVWRKWGGGRQPCVLIMDSTTSELVSLTCEEPAGVSNAQLLGVTISEELRDGKPVKVIRPTGDADAAFRDRVLHGDGPCPPGYEDIRTAYLASVEEAQRLHAGACPDCELGEIQRKHLRMVYDRQHAAPARH